MKQDTRVLIAFALSFVMLVLWRVLFVKEPPKPAAAPAPQTTAAKQKPSESQPATGKPGASQSSAPAKPAAPVAISVEEGTSAQDIVVESDLYRVTLSTEGAVVKSWVLKKYT
ncbi:MAG TPA: membrane protein insertase YidC, partial [Terriglobia bacterium]|nr:membrane protein insertase YidC [Terriglobia bacterium]